MPAVAGACPKSCAGRYACISGCAHADVLRRTTGPFGLALCGLAQGGCPSEGDQAAPAVASALARSDQYGRLSVGFQVGAAAAISDGAGSRVKLVVVVVVVDAVVPVVPVAVVPDVVVPVVVVPVVASCACAIDAASARHKHIVPARASVAELRKRRSSPRCAVGTRGAASRVASHGGMRCARDQVIGRLREVLMAH